MNAITRETIQPMNVFPKQARPSESRWVAYAEAMAEDAKACNIEMRCAGHASANYRRALIRIPHRPVTERTLRKDRPQRALSVLGDTPKTAIEVGDLISTSADYTRVLLGRLTNSGLAARRKYPGKAQPVYGYTITEAGRAAIQEASE